MFTHQARFANTECQYQKATSTPRWGCPLTVGEQGRELREYGAWLRLRESTSKPWAVARMRARLPYPGVGEGLALPRKSPFPPSGSCVCTFQWALASEFSSASLI